MNRYKTRLSIEKNGNVDLDLGIACTSAHQMEKAQRQLNAYIDEAIQTVRMEGTTTNPEMSVGDETGPAPTDSTWDYLSKRTAEQKQKREQQDHQAEAAPAEGKKPDGVRGLFWLRCPECGNTFGTFLREHQTEVACKCGHQIDLDVQLGRFAYTCPYCGQTRWGRTNLEDPEITIRCKCGEDVTVRWDRGAREYQN